MKWHSRVLMVVTAWAALAGCSSDSDSDSDSAPRASDEGGAAPSNRVSIPASVRNNLGITFAKVQRRNVASTIRIPGAFELRSLARREYRLALPAHVQLQVDQLDRVSAGDVLFRYRSPQWPELVHEIVTSEQAVAAATAQIRVSESVLAEARARRATLLKRLEAIQGADFKRADLEAEAARLESSVATREAEVKLEETRLENASKALRHAIHRAAAAIGMDEATLTEPVAHEGRRLPRYRTIEWIEVAADAPGTVESIHVTHGTFAEAAARVMTVVDPTRIRFRAMGLQSDLQAFVTGMPARIVPPAGRGSDADRSVPAELALGLDADPHQRTVTLFATPEGAEPWMRPGISAFLEVAKQSTDGVVLAIPKAAVVKDGITHVFFKRDPSDANKAVRVEADLGVSDGRWVEIKSGIGPKDEVVLDGVYELKLVTEQSGTTQKGGHFHADGSFHGEH